MRSSDFPRGEWIATLKLTSDPWISAPPPVGRRTTSIPDAESPASSSPGRPFRGNETAGLDHRNTRDARALPPASPTVAIIAASRDMLTAPGNAAGEVMAAPRLEDVADVEV